jgi:hypothetical protein
LPLLNKEDVADIEKPEAIDRREKLSRRYPAIEWLVPVLICTVLFGELLFTASRLSQTADEATHLYSGYRYLKCGDVTVSPEHPPLAKALAAAPLVLLNFNVNCAPSKGNGLDQAFESLQWSYTQDWQTGLTSARTAISLFSVGLCLVVWFAARRMFGFPTALAASLLLIFEPNLLAYGSLVMTDVPVTCMLLLSVFAFYLWSQSRTIPLLLLTGIAAGFTLLTKASGVVVVPILAALAVVDIITNKAAQQTTLQLALRYLLAVSLVCALAGLVVWAGYGMGHVVTSAAPPDLQPDKISTSMRALQFVEKSHVLPPAYLRGVEDAIAIPGSTSVAFVAGKIYQEAPWFSTPFNFLIRNTSAMLVLMVVAAMGICSSLRKYPHERLFLFVPAAIYLAVCLHAGANISVRYLLPLFPFLWIAVAHGGVQLAERQHWLKFVLPCFLLLHAVSSLHAYPNYLSYANELWGGPSQAYKYLPWVDIGQAYPEAKAYLERHPTDDCWLVTGWQWDPRAYGLPCKTSGLYLSNPIPTHIHGTVIVSSTLIADVRLAEGLIAAPFKNATPKDHIGGSALLVYEGDFDTSANAAIAERNLAAKASQQGQMTAALEHENKAVELAPASVIAHADLCILLARSRVDLALRECSTAQNLLLRDPMQAEEGRIKYLRELSLGLDALHKRYRLIYGSDPVESNSR